MKNSWLTNACSCGILIHMKQMFLFVGWNRESEAYYENENCGDLPEMRRRCAGRRLLLPDRRRILVQRMCVPGGGDCCGRYRNRGPAWIPDAGDAAGRAVPGKRMDCRDDTEGMVREMGGRAPAVTKMKYTVQSSYTKAMEWLGKLDCIESSLNCAELSAEKRESLKEHAVWIRHSLNVLPDEERRILLWIADGCSVDEMCEMLSREKSSLYKLRKRAIHHFTVAMFGRTR